MAHPWLFKVIHRQIGEVLRKTAHLLLERETAALLWLLRHEYARYLAEAPPAGLLVSALIAAEDHRFALHRGLDLVALARALARRVFRGTVEGASTIEQQLVRTLINRRERTISRKCREILMAAVVTEVVPKRDIPGLYLSVAYFGWGTGGFREALAQLQFSQADLTLREVSEVVARLKYPAPIVPPVLRTRQINARAAHIRLKLQCTQARRATANEEALNAGVPGIG